MTTTDKPIRVPRKAGYTPLNGRISKEAADAEPAASRIDFNKTENLPADLGPPPEMEPPKTRPLFTISTTVQHRGRTFTIATADLRLDALCDLLDKAGYAPAAVAQVAAPLATPDDLPDGWKLCRKHGAPMRPRNKQNEHWHSHNVGTADKPLWCKGYKGADSPGYECE